MISKIDGSLWAKSKSRKRPACLRAHARRALLPAGASKGRARTPACPPAKASRQLCRKQRAAADTKHACPHSGPHLLITAKHATSCKWPCQLHATACTRPRCEPTHRKDRPQSCAPSALTQLQHVFDDASGWSWLRTMIRTIDAIRPSAPAVPMHRDWNAIHAIHKEPRTHTHTHAHTHAQAHTNAPPPRQRQPGNRWTHNHKRGPGPACAPLWRHNCMRTPTP